MVDETWFYPDGYINLQAHNNKMQKILHTKSIVPFLKLNIVFEHLYN
jgi:hypothetical protein